MKKGLKYTLVSLGSLVVFDPDPFLAELGEQGLPWHELFDTDIEL